MKLCELIEQIQAEIDLYASRGSNAKPAPVDLDPEDWNELYDEMVRDPYTLVGPYTKGFQDIRVLGVQIRCRPPLPCEEQDRLAEEYDG